MNVAGGRLSWDLGGNRSEEEQAAGVWEKQTLLDPLPASATSSVARLSGGGGHQPDAEAFAVGCHCSLQIAISEDGQEKHSSWSSKGTTQLGH